MTLRKKTFLIVVSVFLGMILILFFVAQRIILGSYADMPGDIYEQVQTSITYLILVVVGIGLVFGGVTLLLLERQVLSRLSRLSKSIFNIGTGGDLSARVSATGVDELSSLGHTINGMLAALQESEDELRESEELYRLLTENVTDIIFTMDTNLRFTYVSPSVVQLTGYSVEEARANTLEEVFTPASLDVAMKAFAEEVAIEKMEQKDLARSRILEVEVRRKDGSMVWCELKMTALRDANAQVVEILGVARDMTERRQAEDKLRELHQHERDLRQKLEEEMQKRVEFTRTLVHELKTPITPVLAASELLLEEIKEKRLLGLVQSIGRSASNLNRRIDELLDLARGEMDMLELQRESVDPIQLLQEISYEVIPVVLRGGQSLNLELPSTLSTVWADRERLRQIVLNLLNNAFKFTPAGGKITLRAREDGANLVVEIEDTGPGISKEDQKRLFEPYHRVAKDRERLSGLGLGLALSKSLVELHGGQIWVNSRRGKGSTFGFSVPLEAASREEEGVELRGTS